MDLELTDKVAVVTGSSRGIGLAIAAALLNEGCRVTICARGAARLGEAATELSRVAGSTARIHAVSADLATADGVATVISQTADTFGGVDVLINNVGFAGGAGLVDTSD